MRYALLLLVLSGCASRKNYYEWRDASLTSYDDPAARETYRLSEHSAIREEADNYAF